MHDKAVRRRRAVLAVLVALSLILLTAYYGGGENSPLHSIQQGVVETFTPIQEGASKVLSPVRDLAGWVSSTLHAKSQNAQLRQLNASLAAKLSSEPGAVSTYERLEARLHMTSQLSLSAYGPVSASAIGYDPEVWYETVRLDKGAGAGIRDGDPVLSNGHLVGEISSVGSNYAVVASLSNPEFEVEARIIDPAGRGGVGILTPSAVGNPTTLQIADVPSGATIGEGDEVVTAGYSDPNDSDISGAYPAGIPIGVISSFNYNQLANDGSVDVSSFANLRNVGRVTVLTQTNR